MLQISQDAIDEIVNGEVGSTALYVRRYQRPEWPEGASGITIGIGYDCGYQTANGIRQDWSGVIPDEQILLLEMCAGKKGASAQARLSWIRPQVLVPLDAAMHVFLNVDMPRWITRTSIALPNCELLHPDCLGALTSLSYNRGCSYDLTGPRYVEMNNIKRHMIAKEFDKIPAEIRSMKRLWNNGLVSRREREALLFEKGLAAMAGNVPVPLAMVSPHKQKTQDSMVLGGGAGSAVLLGAFTSSSPHDASFFIIVGLASVLCFVTGWSAIQWMYRFERSPRADP